MDIERVIVRLVADATAYNRVMTEAEVRLLRFARTTSTIGDALNVPVMMATGAITALGIAAAAAAYESAKLTATYEQMGIAIEVMTGSAEKAQTILKEITQLAVESPFKTPGLVAAAKQLRSFGIETDQLLPTLKALGDVASGVNIGNIDQTMARISLAYGQIRTAGRLMGPELRQLNEAGVPIIENLSKVMNKPVSSIKALVEEGKVGFPIVVQAFNRMTQEGGLFYQMMERQNKTVLGQWNAFIESLQLFGMKVGASFFKAFGIQDMLAGLTAGLRGGDVAKIDKFFADLKKAFDEVLAGIKMGIFLVQELIKAGKAWIINNKEVIVSILAISTVIYVIVKAVGILLLVLNPLGLAITGIVAALYSVGAFDTMFQTIIEGMTALEGTFTKTWKGMQDAIAGGDTELASKIFFKGLELGFRQLIGILEGMWYDFIYGLIERSLSIPKAIGNAAIDVAQFMQKRIDPRPNAAVERAFQSDRDALEARYQGAIRAVRGDRDTDKAGLLDTPAIRKAKAELAELTGTAAGLGGLKSSMSLEDYQAAMSMLHGNTASNIFEYKAGLLDPRTLQEYKTGRGLSALGGAFAAIDPYRLRVNKSQLGFDNAFMAAAQYKLVEQGLYNQTVLPFITNLAGSVIAGALGGGGGLGREGIRGPLQIGADAQKVAEDVTKRMGLRQISPLDHFNQQMSLLSEGFFGPNVPTGFGAAFGGLGMASLGKGLGPLSSSGYEYGIFEEYEKLRRAIQPRTDRLPPFALRGSQEAQEIINKAQQQTLSVQEEIRNTLQQAAEEGKARTRYMQQVVEELRKLNASQLNDFLADPLF